MFISAFRYLSITSPLKDHFTLLPGVNISNMNSKKQELIDDQIIRMIGIIELNHLMSSPNIVFYDFSKKDLRGNEVEKFLLILLIWIKSLFKSAWVLFDHNMDCESAFLFHFIDGQLVKCTSNFLAQRSTRADCSINEISIEIDSLREWERIHHKINTYFHTKESSDLRFFMEKGYCRSGRALQFIESARNSRNIGFKIAHYISAFEALFSTSPTELAHKLSERVAYLLGAYGYSKIEVFQNMKAAYEMRSKLVHGDSISDKKIDGMSRLSICCDNYLRKIMQLLFSEIDLKKEIDVAPNKLDNYFEQMLFGRK